MTFSIVAASDATSAWGIAVASRFLAVGAIVPGAAAGAGAVATQAFANASYRPEGLRMLRQGRTAQEVLDLLIDSDTGHAERQAGIVDRAGGSATYTGDGCLPWAGGVTGPGYAIQGNILVGPAVVAAMERQWLAGEPDRPLGDRLLDALRAGDDAGGDRRGRQSAALLVVAPEGGYGGGSDVVADLRVDDHLDPVPELARLLDLHHLYFDRPDPNAALPLEGAVAEEVTAHLARLGYLDLETWMGVHNYEERALPGKIDPVVLDKLREAAQ